MDAKLKQRWVAALRSGKYQKGERYLRPSDQRFCVLGVLADVDEPGGWRRTAGEFWLHTGSYTVPSKSLLKKWGLPKSTSDCLTRMNDRGYSFAKLADYIERNV